ncbi:unnamed protein product [Linum tenue]|uniref:ADP-ribosyl cyclase/cyclic ADP-ribose hydrolase n=1 Tax=Linum tenue TaxID=586396 RepID=A0AAV0L3A5_9ROSI|nr:unnamed protein product [Linum tenue]
MASVVLILLLLLLLFLGALCHTAATTNPRPPPWRHHVFLNHRGPDGRHTFADHLDYALRRKRIKVFRDDHDLPRGENVTEAISRAIEESMHAVHRRAERRVRLVGVLPRRAGQDHELQEGERTPGFPRLLQSVPGRRRRRSGVVWGLQKAFLR